MLHFWIYYCRQYKVFLSKMCKVAVTFLSHLKCWCIQLLFPQLYLLYNNRYHTADNAR